MRDLLCRGPDGSNLLGFLCAVGTLAALSDVWPEASPKLSWTWEAGWRPVLRLDRDASEEEICTAIAEHLKRPVVREALAESWGDLPMPADDFRRYASAAIAAARPDDRWWADFASGLACAVDGDPQGGKAPDTALRTMSGVGHQYFLGSIRTLVEETESMHLAAALFDAWRYEDPGPALRWDPGDDRRYAYRGDNPAKSSTFPIRTVRGANRLAAESLRVLTVVPGEPRAKTVLFVASAGAGRRDAATRWPLWRGPLGPQGVRSLLTHPDVVAEPPNFDRLAALGVDGLYESVRVTEGRYRNFQPARAVFFEPLRHRERAIA
jgi:hypothetical protein